MQNFISVGGKEKADYNAGWADYAIKVALQVIYNFLGCSAVT
jgi:hypothetical protein